MMHSLVSRLPCARPSRPARTAPTCTIILDWDDTIFSSTWMVQQGMSNTDMHAPARLTEEVKQALGTLAESVVALLRCAKALGRVVVVTNAHDGWVETSAQRYLGKGVVEELDDVPIVSARHRYGVTFPSNPVAWKVAAFYDVLGPLQSPHHVVSLGDSLCERSALGIVVKGREREGVVAKSVKFMEEPTADVLTRQLDLLCACLDAIVAFQGSLDLKLAPHHPA